MAKSKAIAMEDNRWQAEDDARTLMRAHEVMNDPKRHGAAQQHSMKQMEALQKVVKSKPSSKPVRKPVSKGAKKK